MKEQWNRVKAYLWVAYDNYKSYLLWFAQKHNIIYFPEVGEEVITCLGRRTVAYICITESSITDTQGYIHYYPECVEKLDA